MNSDAQVLAVVIRSVLGLFALLYLWQWVYLPTMTEHFRQNVFALRRDMFLRVADGRLDPNEPAYGYIRDSMNATLRIAERFTLSRLFLSILVIGRFKVLLGRGDELVARIEDEAIRKEFEGYRVRLSVLVVWHVALISPITLPLILLLTLTQAIARLAAPLRKSLSVSERMNRIPPGMVETEARVLTGDTSYEDDVVYAAA